MIVDERSIAVPRDGDGERQAVEQPALEVPRDGDGKQRAEEQSALEVPRDINEKQCAGNEEQRAGDEERRVEQLVMACIKLGSISSLVSTEKLPTSFSNRRWPWRGWNNPSDFRGGNGRFFGRWPWRSVFWR